MAHDVFLSYASEDKALADAACATLESRKIRCWIAPRDIMPGVPYGEAILNAITRCKVMIIFLSEKSNDSPHVANELERAVHNRKAVIPVRIEDVYPRGQLEYFLAGKHWLDALTPPIEAHLQKLADIIIQLVGLEKQEERDERKESQEHEEKVEDVDAGFRAMKAMAEANKHREKNEYETALPLYEDASRLYDAADDLVGEGKALYYGGLCLVPSNNPNGDWGKAHDLFQRSAALRKQAKELGTLADTLNWAGWCLMPDKNTKGDWFEAARFFNESYEAAKGQNDVEMQAIASNNWAYCLHPDVNPKGSWEKAAEGYARVVKLREPSNNPTLASNITSWAECLIQRKVTNMTPEAEALFKRAAALARRRGDQAAVDTAEKWLRPSDAVVWKERGDSLRLERKFKQAVNAFLKAAEMYGARMDGMNQGWCIRLAAACLEPTKNPDGSWDEAVALYRQSLKVSEDSGDQIGIANAYAGLASCTEKSQNPRGDWSVAAEYRLKAAIYYAAAGQKGAESDSLHWRGNCLDPRNNPRGTWEEAADAFRKAAKAAEQGGFIEKQGISLNKLGVCLVQGDRNNMTQEAYMIFKLSAKLLRQAGNETSAKTSEDWVH